MRFVCLSWITKAPGRAQVGFVPNKHNPSTELGLGACISSRITVVIHVRNDYQINDNCFNEPFAVSPCKSLYWDMHGLIFETSIWLLAGSTRFIPKSPFIVTGTESMHTSPRRLNTIFPTNVVETTAAQLRAGPGEHPQTAHNQAARDSKDHPCPQKRARTKYSQEGKNSFKVPWNSARKSKFASPGGPRHRTGGHDAVRSSSTAPPHQKATRTTAGPCRSGATGKPTPPTHT